MKKTRRNRTTTSVETKHKTSYGLYGETRRRIIWSTCRRQMEKKNKKTATTPAASTYNIIVDTDGLKPQDDTAAV